MWWCHYHMTSGCTITCPNYGKAYFSQLVRIYNADAVNSKQTPAGWGREWKPTEMFTQVVFEQMETMRSLPYFVFSGSLVFWETALSPSAFQSLIWFSTTSAILRITVVKPADTCSQESRHLFNLREHRIWIMILFRILSLAHEGL